MALRLEPSASRKAKAQDALKQVGMDPVGDGDQEGEHQADHASKGSSWVFLEIGKIFWEERRHQKARKFLNQAVNLDKDNGDAWAYLLKFEHE